jgi:hypothetical protein
MQYKAEIEQTETENFKAAGFEVGYYGNQHKRSFENWEWYQSAPSSQTRGIRYYPAVFFREEHREKVEAMGGKNIALIGH